MEQTVNQTGVFILVLKNYVRNMLEDVYKNLLVYLDMQLHVLFVLLVQTLISLLKRAFYV